MFVSWIVALVATLGSLFFSEVMGLPPCILCWYQRIAMYPLVVILSVGLGARDPRVLSYAGPLVAVGLCIATYHNLLYYHLIADSLAPCRTGVSCTDRQIEWFGFVTIPLLSLVAFTAIAASLLLVRQRVKGARVS